MRKKSFALALASIVSLGTITPSFAEGIVGDVVGLVGSSVATVIDTPQGAILGSLWRYPYKTQRALADRFGDDKGFQQNIAAFVIGVPVGMVWGVPAGALQGAKHGIGTGWEKPFSTESFIVSDEK